MSEESNKRQSREIATTVFAMFEPFGYGMEPLNGNPFHIRVFHERVAEDWEFRCVPEMTKSDIEAVEKARRPAHTFKRIAYRPFPGSKKIVCKIIE
jgi:hypothetical protein